MKHIATILITLLSFLNISAQEQNRKIISLLTCEPSNNQIYTAWGHSALRVCDPENGIDMVFNYGIFSFDEIGTFIYRFVKGETDYMLGVSTFQHSKRDAVRKNAHLYEQVLNLNDEETEKICDALFENAKPENCYYRYNFFYDNCATRPRVVIEKSVDGEITYPQTDNRRTYRDIIHEMLKEMKWYTLGIDMCMGSPTDNVVEGKDIQFLPIEMMKCFEEAAKPNGEKLVKETNLIYTPIAQETEADFASKINPAFACWMLLVLIIVHTLFYTYINKNDKWFDGLFFGIAGLIGFALSLLSFFSEHPCTFPNFNLLWINPLQLIFAISLISKRGENVKNKFHQLNLGLIGITIITGWTILPQELNINCLPLMLSLATRSLHWLKPNFFKIGQKKANEI